MGVIGAPSSSSIGFLSGAGSDDGNDKWDERITLAPLMATLLLPILIGAILVIKCVYGHCCARKSSTKDEMYGVEGRMTMLTNSDADAAFLTSPSASSANYVPNSDNPASLRQTQLLSAHHNKLEATKSNTITPNIKTNNNNPDVTITNDMINPMTASVEFPTPLLHRSECDLSDTLRRATGKRQLPDLPELPQHSLGHPPRRNSSVLSHDGTSELYATVGEVPNPYAQLKIRHSIPNDVCQPSTSRGGRKKVTAADFSGSQKNSLEPNPSSDSETYASSVHPYAKLKRNSAEHPYARVRNASLNDEETDTDNYDMPQPYAQSRGRSNNGGGSGAPNVPNSSMTATTSGSASTAGGQGPVPPRRIGRQWRSQPQTSVDSTTHFSGDSQDSRGYTSISVREPLSNIRSQVTGGRIGDSHYATVSDDSEEMYAAIDDSVDGNYMQIPEGERPNRPSWLDATNVGSPSPIPERREANSPLPPVPAVPPPLLLEGGGVAISPIGSPALAPPRPHTPPVYAQVTKKTKKNKAPVTPTASNASTSSQQTFAREQEETEPGIGSNPDNNVVPGPSPSGIGTPSSKSSSSTHHHSHNHHQHHRSKSRTLMDNTNLLESNISEHRRWSKADISYSEFEVVRETLIPPPKTTPVSELKKSPVTFSLSSNSERMHSHQSNSQHVPLSPRDSVSSRHSIISQNNELLDEDNYNVIPDKRSSNNEQSHRHSGSGGQGRHARNRVDSDNYQEIGPISNTYQEIGKQSSLDHYQEIGSALQHPNGSLVDNDDQDDTGSGLYQEIRKTPKEGDDYDEDDDDQFYEKVRPSTTNSQSQSQPGLTIPHPSGRKHGYEKIKRKAKSPSPKPKGRGVSDDDGEEEEGGGDEEEDLMYEKVKYPPYERLKESRSDLAVNATDASVEDDEDGGSNLYEHIGYSRVKPKNIKVVSSSNNSTAKNKEPLVDESVDLDQLYAVVDKSKKKGKGSGSTSIRSSSTTTNNNNPQNYNNNNPSLDNNLSSSSTSRSPYSTSRFASTSVNSPNATTITSAMTMSKVGLSLHHSDIDFIDDNNEIEYI